MYVWMTRIRSAVLPRRARGLCSCVVLEECNNFSVSEMKNRRGTVYVHVCVAASGIARRCHTEIFSVLGVLCVLHEQLLVVAIAVL